MSRDKARRAPEAAGLAARLLGSAIILAPAWASADDGAFRVCADPNNLPFSDLAGNGFENKLAELVAGELGQKIEYTWFAQRRGFVRNTLKAGNCDVIMGVPAHYDLVATTRPYYRSTYVFVSRADRNLDLSSMTDPRLRELRVGVHLIGDDGANTPPAHALGEEGIVNNVEGFMIYGDYRTPAPPARLVEAVEDSSVDVAAVWGPLAGYFAQSSPVPLRISPITDTARFAPLAFTYEVAMGVRKGDDARRQQLDMIIAERAAEICQLLSSYGVPLVEDVP